MALTAEQKKEILGSYGLHATDTGSPEAQVAMLTKRIADLTEHSSSTSTTTTRGADCCCWSGGGAVCSNMSPSSTWSATAR